MPVAAVMEYVQGLLNGLAWPEAIQVLSSPPPSLAAYVMPPNPNTQGATPTACIWFELWSDSRANDRDSAGTIPRAAGPGEASGTRSLVHQLPIYLVWLGGAATDPVAASVFAGMVDTVSAMLRTTALPVPLTDPWGGTGSTVVDIGEVMRGRGYLRDLEPQMSPVMLDALLSVQVVEIIRS